MTALKRRIAKNTTALFATRIINQVAGFLLVVYASRRLGVEDGTHLSSRWEVGVAATWDAKWNYYDAWGINFTVSRLFGGGH